MGRSGHVFASFLAAIAAGAALPHEGGRRFYEKNLTKKASGSKKQKRKRRQKSQRRNR